MIDPAPREEGKYANDVRLVGRALRGEEVAREHLADRIACVRPFLSGRNRRFGAPLEPDALEDLCQDTLVALWGKLDRYAGLSRIETWACGFALRQMWRALSRGKRPTGVALEEDHVVETQPARPGVALDMEQVRESVQQLDEQTAEIVHLRHFEEWSFEEIARELAVPLPTAKTKYYRGLARLRALLGRFWREISS